MGQTKAARTIQARRLIRQRATTEKARAQIPSLAESELFVAGVVLYWAEGSKAKPWRPGEQVDLIKRHNPKTVRKNSGDDYHGCLIVYVRRSTELYRQIAGWWAGIVDSVFGDRPMAGLGTLDAAMEVRPLLPEPG